MVLHPKNSWGANTAPSRLWEGGFRGQDRAGQANPAEGSFEALPWADPFLNLEGWTELLCQGGAVPAPQGLSHTWWDIPALPRDPGSG